MIDPADFQLPDTPEGDSTPGRGHSQWKHLPAVLQLVSYGPGHLNMLCVASSRMYLDNVSRGAGHAGEQGQP